MQPGTPSRILLALLWLVVGTVMAGVAVWVGLTRWQVLLTGHPALLVGGLAVAAAGLFALIWGVASLVAGGSADRDRATGTPRSTVQLRRRATRRLVLAAPLLALALLLAGGLAWLRPFPAEATALTALRSSGTVRVVDRITWYELQPARRAAGGSVPKPTTGLVFVPGARVDPRAYARLLRPLAEGGFVVIVLKEPANLARPGSDHALAPIGLYPDVRYWAVGGHSLGGVSAAALADREPKLGGLVLYASYPAARMERTDLRTTSLYGSADGLTTLADVAGTRDRLPRTTRFVGIKGAVHSYFGDYGLQPGDGTPTVAKTAAQAKIVAETRALLVSLRPAPPRKR